MTSDGTRAAKIEPPYDETASNSKCVVLEALPYIIDAAITGLSTSAASNTNSMKRKQKNRAFPPSFY